MSNIPPAHLDWLYTLSEAQLRTFIAQMSVNPTEAQQAYVGVLEIVLEHLMARQAL